MTPQVLSDQASPAEAACVALLRAYAAAARVLSAELHDRHALTIKDYEALLYLSQAEGRHMRRVDLAERLLLTASGVTRLLDGLEAAGHVEKGTCAADARVTYAVLTDAGLAKLREASATHLASVRALFGERLSDGELSTLAELLGRLPGAADEPACETTAG